MKTLCVCTLLILLALTACRAPAPAPEPAPETAHSDAKTAPADESMMMKGINLYMHRHMPEDGVPGRPELWVKADSIAIEDNETYTFENAQAVIYGLHEDEITLAARRGRFEQDKKAYLEGDVRLEAGTLNMLLENLHWLRDDVEGSGIVRSERPVIIDDPDLQLNASSLRIDPDNRVFELTGVSGVVRFGKELL